MYHCLETRLDRFKTYHLQTLSAISPFGQRHSWAAGASASFFLDERGCASIRCHSPSCLWHGVYIERFECPITVIKEGAIGKQLWHHMASIWNIIASWSCTFLFLYTFWERDMCSNLSHHLSLIFAPDSSVKQAEWRLRCLRLGFRATHGCTRADCATRSG